MTVKTFVKVSGFPRAAVSDPKSHDRLVLVVGVQGGICLVQNHVPWSQRRSQEHVDPHGVGETKKLQQNRLSGIKMQRERRCDQIPAETFGPMRDQQKHPI